MMQQRCYFAFALLCSLSLPPWARSLQCTNTQYGWKTSLCCDMCQPGHYLFRRCSSDSPTQCKPCDDGRYMNTYNEERGCDFCENCNNSANLEYKSHCNATHNAVCKCKSGYECADQPCKKCVPVPPTTTTTTKPTPTPTLFRTALTSDTIDTEKTAEDTLWLMITLLLIVTAAIVLINLRAALQSITSKCGYLLAKTQEPVSTSSEDEEVTKPVQEAGNITKIKMDP